MIGISSYIEPGRKGLIRKTWIKLQIQWLRQEFPDETILTVAQGPHDAAVDSCDRVLQFSGGIGQSNAINYILSA